MNGNDFRQLKVNGSGSYQREKAYNAQRLIFKALFDGQWHRNMELREKTGLSLLGHYPKH